MATQQTIEPISAGFRQPDAVVEGHPVWFTRRRYGRQTFTWAGVLLNGEMHDLGDPWPAVIYPRRELQRLIGLELTRRQEKESK